MGREGAVNISDCPCLFPATGRCKSGTVATAEGNSRLSGSGTDMMANDPMLSPSG